MFKALLRSVHLLDVERLRGQLSAWWEGDVPPPPEPTDPAQDSARGLKRGPAARRTRPQEPLLAAHLTIAQLLWGRGFTGPGDSAFILDLVRQLGLTRDRKLAYIGLGLGGAAREIAKKTGVRIAGYEMRPDLVEAAAEQSHMAGLARKVTARPLTLGGEAPCLPENRFNIVVSRDELCCIEDKETLLAQIHASLRAGGFFLLTDYVVPEEGLRAGLEERAFSRIWGEPHLWTPGQYSAALAETGFDVRIKKDISSDYEALIGRSAGGWGRVLDLATRDSHEDYDTVTFMRAVAREAAVWAERLEALKSGRLAVFRYLALKPDAVIR